MNKKGFIFTPIIVFGLIILLGTYLLFISLHMNKTKENYSIGKLQSDIIKNYLESEKEFFYYEKLLEYNEYNAVKEFADNGALLDKCSERWKFNTECEPKFKDNFNDILIKKLEGKNKAIKIDSEIEVYFTDFNLPSESSNAKVEYKGKIIVKKQPLINFQDLEKLKIEIKNCIQNNDIDKCGPESNSNNVYKFKKEIAEILDEKFEKETIYLEFEIDTKDSGLMTSIF